MQILRTLLFGLIFLFQPFSPQDWGLQLWASTLAKTPNPFQDDLSMLDAQMSDLDHLENWVLKYPTTQTQMTAEGNVLVKDLLPADDLSSALLGGSAPSAERLLGIPGFLWGFCCSVVGMFLVYVAIDDPVSRKKEGTQAIYGCAAGTLVTVGLYFWALYYLSYY